MLLSNEERAVLVEELEAAVAGRLAVGIVLNRFSSRELDCVKTGDEIVDKAVMPIIDRLTTRREPAADAVERAAEAMFTLEKDASGALVQWDDLLDNYGRNGVAGKAVYRDLARAALQAAAVEPEPGLSLDTVEAMLDDPNVVSALGRSFAQRRNGESDYDSRPSYRSFCDGEGVSEVEAALAVMREVQAAVRQAKENGDG